jgi:hypothetical protein
VNDRHGTPSIPRSISRPCPSVHSRATVASSIRLNLFVTPVLNPLHAPYPTSHPPPHPFEPRFNTISTSTPVVPHPRPAHPPHEVVDIPPKSIALTGILTVKGSLPSLDTTQGPDTTTAGFASFRFRFPFGLGSVWHRIGFTVGRFQASAVKLSEIGYGRGMVKEVKLREF